MKTKAELYRKKFIFAIFAIELGIIGGMLFYAFAFYNGDFQGTILFYTVLSILNLVIVSLFYFYEPNPKIIVSKTYFTSIGTRHFYFFTIFSISVLLAFVLPLGLENSIPMPISGFYGYLVIVLGIFWCVVFNKQLRQIFDVLVIYIKDSLYPDTWPAEMREDHRKYDLELQYREWLLHGTIEEQNFYNNLCSKSEIEARNYAASRMNQIQNEKKIRN